MMGWYDGGMGWWGYAGMGVGIALFCVLVIGGTIALIAVAIDGGKKQWPAVQPPSPEQLLATRFARGEITEAEYRDRVAVLHGHSRQ